MDELASATFDAADLVAEIHHDILERGERLDATDGERLLQIVEHAAPLCSADEVDALALLVRQRLFGLGPIEALLADDSVDEVMINGPGPVWVERTGSLERSNVYVDDFTLRMIIERIVAPLGLRVDRTVPFVDARLPDGSRAHVAVPPLALDGPYVTIRRFAAAPFLVTDFGGGAAAALLVEAVRRRASFVVSGGTGSGKTSLLNALATHIPVDERVITVEDSAELRIEGRHVVRLEARPANAEGTGEITMRTLVRNALRMRPDRIIVGEVRGAEALDMVQAMNTGHDGSMSTCHANSAPDALRRLETMVLMSDVDLPLDVARDHLRSALDLMIHVARSHRGARSIETVLGRVGHGYEPLLTDDTLTNTGERWMAAAPG